MDLKNRTLSNFAELVETGECKNFKGRLKVGCQKYWTCIGRRRF